jgi:serine/threonine protein kinase
MEENTVLGHYRISTDNHGAPHQLGQCGAATTYEAVDERSGDTVSLTLVPISSIDPAAREQFNKQARAVRKLRHINIAKTLDFGRDGKNFAYVSEHLPGETLASWIAAHGPMPADAVLRVASQVVSALSVANFHKLIHPAIQPSNLMMVAGPTAEGGWPFVKLVNFGLAGLKSASETVPGGDLSDAESGATGKSEKSEESFSVAQEFASPEQSRNEPADFRSEIYSLGATMYFLLTSTAPSALLRRQHLGVFPKPLRNLLAQMLSRNPDRRPKDPAVLEKMIHECLLKIERRQALADKYGIPFRTTLPRAVERHPMPVLRRALAVGSIVLAAALIAGVVFQKPMNRIWQRYHGSRKVGVLIGVSESSPSPAIQNAPNAPAEPATVLSQAANNALALANQPPANQSATTNSGQVTSPDQQPQASNAQLEATAPSAGSPSEAANAIGATGESSAQPNAESPPVTTGQSSQGSKKKHVASTSQRRPGSMRARMVGITSDGRLIYRFPSGRIAIVAPDSDEDETVPRRHRRGFIDPDEMLAPPPRFAPEYFPND